MPIYNPIIRQLDQAEVLRYAGLKSGTPFPAELVDEACMQAQLLVRPAASWAVYPYNNHDDVIIAETAVPITGAGIQKHLYGAQQIAVLAVTIGNDLEQMTADWFSNGKYTLALLLDAAGTVAVEAAADSVEQLLRQQQMQHGWYTTPRFSPGYGGWDVSVQPSILELAVAHQIGMTHTASCMLVPRKSITAVIGISTGPKEGPEPHGCLVCRMENCRIRRVSV